jgi:hypothetical protein
MARLHADEKKLIIAKLTMVVTYDELPDADDVREVVEKAKELGAVESAVLEIFGPSKIDLT